MRTAVLVSGGVDSSVALHLVLEEAQRTGGSVTAFYLKIWLEDELAFLGECPWEDDLRYARAVCERAGVDLEVVSLQRFYHDVVVRWAIDELRAGRTPSPDILCNKAVKFGAFLDHLDGLGSFDRVASGHYARVRQNASGEFELWRGVDATKDQTYFLYALDQRQLSRCHFPLGDWHKARVRQRAHQLELPNRDRPDSQGICFLGKIAYPDFVAAHLGRQPGEIRDIDSGGILGTHQGHWFFTVGQRRGLGLGGGPWFVVAKETETNVVWVTHRRELTQRLRGEFFISQMHWISPNDPMSKCDKAPENDDGLVDDLVEDLVEQTVGVKIRHTPQICSAQLTRINSDYRLRLAQADPGVAPGQSAVLYDQERCLGGGQIMWFHSQGA